jgi:hypothetical protein
MNTPDGLAVYESSVRFEDEPIRTAAVYCSDGRFGQPCDDFLQSALQLARYDRLAVPGGAACLAGQFPADREEEALVEQLRFMIRVRALERVVLIAHQDCLFYVERLHVPLRQVETRQRQDVQTAVERIRSLGRNLSVEAFFARKGSDGTIRFESLDLWSSKEAAF